MSRDNHRVLLITSNFPRWEGDSTTPFVLNLAADLVGQGWQVDVLAPHAPGAARRETMAGVDVRRFRYLLPESQQTVCYGGGALINLRESRANWFKVPALVAAELLVTIGLLIRRRYRVINAHWLLPQGFVGGVAGFLTRTPLVATVHGGDVFDLTGSFLGRFKRWAIRRARVVTVNSSATEQATTDIEPRAQVTTIPMGVETGDVDTAMVKELRNIYRPESGPLLVFVGRLVAEKGVADLIRALPIVQEQHPDSRLLVIGEGQDRDAFESLTDELDLAGSVTFTGWVDPNEVPSYLGAADVFVGPSKRSATGWREGLGLVFLEAMQAGTPVVATRSGGIVDIVLQEETGLLVPEESPAEIAAAVERIVANPELAQRMIGAGKELVAGSYTRKASAQAFARLFEQVSA